MPEKLKKADQYNDPSFNYVNYWDGRQYEHQAEVMAINRLLRGKHFKKAVDIGGGYGRLTSMLRDFADSVTLAEPSQQQLDLAKKHLANCPDIIQRLMQAEKLEFSDSSIDLIIMIRVMHHLPDPRPELKEISRVLTDDGGAIIEVANYMHARNRIKHLVSRQPFPTEPVDIRTNKDQSDGLPFVNHNPYTVMKQLTAAGLKVERILSVSNLRSSTLKKLLPRSAMLVFEGVLQPTLSKTFFGPSVFFLVKK
jgi:SAM-dependent methyltransferase